MGERPDGPSVATASAEPPARRGALRRLYDWVLSWASSPYGVAALFAIAFIESSFFPIPPDPLLMALCLGARHRALQFAAWCTAGSVLGGLFGYMLGHFAFELAAQPILMAYGKLDDYHRLAETFRASGDIAVLVAAITPVPYKLVTLTAGAMGMSVPAFLAASVVGRGARFFLVAGLLWWKGDTIAAFIERRFELLTVVFGLLLVGGFVASRWLF